jgi:hypothetical protein
LLRSLTVLFIPLFFFIHKLSQPLVVWFLSNQARCFHPKPCRPAVAFVFRSPQPPPKLRRPPALLVTAEQRANPMTTLLETADVVQDLAGTTRPERPPRHDKGTVEITERDIRTLRWIGEQYAVRFDTLQKLLGRDPKNLNDHAPVDGILSERNTRKAVRRWLDEGLVDYRKLLFAERGYVWLTYKGSKAAKLLYKTYSPSISPLNHFHHLNELRLNLEVRYKERLIWTCERELRRAHERLDKDKKKGWHMPDALITLDGREIAVEAEITQKSDKRLAETIEQLARQYKAVWYFVAEDTREAVVKAIGSRTQTFRVYSFAEVVKPSAHG